MKRVFSRAIPVVMIWLTLVCLVPPALWAASTVMKSGEWLALSSPELVQAEIDSKVESICLPRLEFVDSPDQEELLTRLRSEIKKQKAVFHLFKDELGIPIRKGYLLFASDVYLKDLKITYSAAMRAWGYRFKVHGKPAYEDPGYTLQVQRGSSSGGTGGKVGDSDPHLTPGGGRGGGSLMSADAFLKAAYTVLPPGALPRETRRMKEEIDRRVRALKDRPYQAEVFRVDVVRWASGVSGSLASDGVIRGAAAEGQKVDFQLPLPSQKDWLTPERSRELASQTCEFVIHRTRQGRDAEKAGVFQLADLYLTDLAENWDEWLTRHSLTLASRTIDADFATAPVTLDTVGVEAEWCGLRAPALIRVKILDPKFSSGEEETVRLRSSEVRLKNFRGFAGRLNKAYRGKTIHLTLLVSADGRPYLEFGQKRVARILLRDQQKTLLMLMREAKTTEK